MDSTKITHQKDGWVESYMVGTKITRQRLENSQGMDGTKITCQRDGRVESYMVDIKITRQRMEN